MEPAAEATMRTEIHDMLVKLAENDPEHLSWYQVAGRMNDIAEKYGCEYGIPIPSMYSVERPMITARNVPLGGHPYYPTELHEEMAGKLKIRNSWHVLGDQEICVVEVDGEILAYPQHGAGRRLRKLLDTSLMRDGTPQTAEAEMRAMESLKKRISGRQWQSYVLSGVFPERSKRSDLHYFFRKGYPTLVLSYHGEGSETGRVIAALCLHPVGYFQGTHCGIMCPTDEVICALLMMRGDEHKYWQSCGQWPATDMRSGL